MTMGDYCDGGAGTEDLYARACRCLVGGVDSPVRAWKYVGGTPFFISSANGATIRDTGGVEYRDYVGSWGPMILGHACPDVVRAISGAASRSSSFGATCRDEVELAELIAGKFPSIDKVRFVNSGTEATMTAIRLARACTGRERIMKFAGNYHGHHDAMLVAAGSGALCSGVPTSPGVTVSVAGDTIVAPFNSADSAARVFDESGDRIAGVIVEPWAGNMGLVPPMPGFLESLRELTRKHGALLIFDEIITGFRIPEFGVQNMLNIKPDLTCLGKIIGGGLPVGAVGGRSEIMDYLSPAGPVYQAGTLAGNPLAMAAGLATLTKLTQTAYQKLDYAASQLGVGLKRAAAAAGIEISISRLGSALGLFFSPRLPLNMESVMATGVGLYPGFFHGMLAGGDYFAPSPYETIFVSLEHTNDIIDRTIANAGEVFAAIARRTR